MGLSGLQKHRYGNAHIQYSGDGRIMVPGTGSYPGRRSPREDYREEAREDHPSKSYYSYDPHRENYRRTNDQGPPPSRRHPEYSAQQQQQQRVYDNRTPDYPGVHAKPGYDQYHGGPGYGSDIKDPRRGDFASYDKTGLIAERNDLGKRGVLVRRTVNEYFKSDFFNPGLFFIFVGLLILVAAILNTVACIDYHYYCRYWIGLIVLEFGIFCLVHKGDYDSTCRNYNLVILGFVSMAGAFVGMAFIMETLAPEIKMIAQLNSTLYVQYIESRPEEPRTEMALDTRVWLCFGTDCTTLILLTVSLYCLLVGTRAANHFWNHHHNLVHNVGFAYKDYKPFCTPFMFNPFSQLAVAEAVILMGILSRYGSEGSKWLDYWSPVWAGAVAIFAAGMSCAAAKRPEHNTYNYWAIFLQIIAMGCGIAAVVMSIMGMADNINTVEENDLPQGYEQDVLVMSALFFALAVAALLVCCFYSAGIIARLVQNVKSNSRRPYGGRYSDTSEDVVAYTAEKDGYLSPVDHRLRGGYYGNNTPSYGQHIDRPDYEGRRWSPERRY